MMDGFGIITSTAGLLGAAYTAYQHLKPSGTDDGLGTFTIHKLAGSDEAEIDIVFVHGLGTTSDKAWTGPGENGQNYRWPIDSLPKSLRGTSSARILAYDYDTTYWTPEYLTERTLLAQTSHLTQGLASFGRKPRAEARPIIFVAHGLGGIVVKNALVLAASSDDSRIRRVFERTAGLVFLGTPHEGCPWAIARDICGMVGSLGIDFREGEYEELLERSTTLAYSLERFKPLARELFVHTFRQGRPRQGQDDSREGVAKCGFTFTAGPSAASEWTGLDLSTGDESRHKRFMTDCDDAGLGRFSEAENKDLQRILNSISSICLVAGHQRPRLTEGTFQWKMVGLSPVEDGAGKKLRCNMGDMLPHNLTLTATESSNEVVEHIRSYFKHSSVSGETSLSYRDGSDWWFPVSATDGRLGKLNPYISKWLLSRSFSPPTLGSPRQSSWPVIILSGPQQSGKTLTALHYARMSQQEDTGYASKLWVDATDRRSLEISFVGIAREIRHQSAGRDADSVVRLLGLDGLLDKDSLEDNELQTLVGAVTDWLEGAHEGRWLLIIDNLSLDSPYPPRKTFSHRLTWRAISAKVSRNSRSSAAGRRGSGHPTPSRLARGSASAEAAIPGPETTKGQAWKWSHWRQLIRLIPFVTGAKGHIIITTREAPNIPGPKQFNMEVTMDDDPLASISADHSSNAEVARVCERQQEYPAARLLYRQELHDLEQKDVPLHDSNNALLLLQMECARTYQAEGRYTEAGAEYENILRQKVVEDEPEKRLSTIRQLAIVRAEQGQIDEAIKQASQGLGLEDPFGGDVENPQVLELTYELSRYLFTAGNRQAASSLLERLVMSLVHVHGFDHPTVLTARDALVQALMSAGDMEPASKQLDCLCKCRSRLLGEDHPVTLLSRAKLGLLLNRRGLVKEAIDTLTRCLAAAERTLATSHPLVFRVRENLYWVLRTQGKDKLAQVQLEKLRREVTHHAGLYSTWIRSTYSDKMSGLDTATNAAWMNRSRSTWMLDQGEDETDDELEF